MDAILYVPAVFNIHFVARKHTAISGECGRIRGVTIRGDATYVLFVCEGIKGSKIPRIDRQKVYSECNVRLERFGSASASGVVLNSRVSDVSGTPSMNEPP